MKTSQVGIDLIKKWEGFKANAYTDSAGVWTIGFGLTVWENGLKVKKGDTITKAQAEAILIKQIDQHASKIESYITVPLTQNQFDALSSMSYNMGRDFLASSSLKTLINQGKLKEAEAKIHEYVYDIKGNRLQGLVNRRKDEANLFAKGGTGGGSVARKEDINWDNIPSEHKKNMVLSPSYYHAYMKAKELGLKFTSGYRDSSKNASVGGAKNSYHTKGQAADFSNGGSQTKEMDEFYKWAKGTGMFTEVIYSPLDGKSNDHYDHVHVAWSGKNSGASYGGSSASDGGIISTIINSLKNLANANNVEFDDEEAGGYAILKQADEMMSFETFDITQPGQFVIGNGKALVTRTLMVVIGLIILFMVFKGNNLMTINTIEGSVDNV